MPNIRIAQLFIFLSIMISINLFSQPTPVEVQKSKDKVIMDGKVYYIHIVKKGQTLYSISKAYNVVQSDIVAVNPDAAVTLKENMSLKIPEAAMYAGEVQLKQSDDYTYHIVEAGQTLYSIANKYHTNIEELKKCNPELEVSNIQVNQVIKIPKPKDTSRTDVIKPPVTSNHKDTSAYISHTVVLQETMYSISKKYNVSVEQIKAANASIIKDELQTGEILRIPVEKENKVLLSDSLVPRKSQKYCDSIRLSYTTRIIHVSLILPLFSDLVNENVISDDTKNDSKNDSKDKIKPDDADINPVAANFLEFYQGSLLALKKLKSEGISVSLDIYDSEKSKNKSDDLLLKPDFANSDLIIGPIFPDNVRKVAAYAKQHQVMMVSPISVKDEFVKVNPYFFQVNPPISVSLNYIVKFLAGYSQENIILIQQEGTPEEPSVKDFKEKVKNILGTNELKEFLYAFQKDMIPLLSETKKNVFIVPSTDEIFVTDLLRYLNGFYPNYQVVLMGISNWSWYNAIDIEYLHNLNFHYFAPFYIDYDDVKVKDFLLNFQSVYGFEPQKTSVYGFNYAMLGYDVFYFFVKSFSLVGNNCGQCLLDADKSSLLTKYNFVQDKITNGYINRSSTIIRFNQDYTVTKLMQLPGEK